MLRANWVLLAFAVLLNAVFLAQILRADTTNPTTATINYQGPVTQTDGFAFDASTTAADFSDPVNWPASFAARYSAAERIRTRWITVRNLSATINVCVAIGSAGVGAALECDPDDSAGGAAETSGVLPPGQSVQILLGSAASLGIPAMPQIWIVAESGTPNVTFDVIF